MNYKNVLKSKLVYIYLFFSLSTFLGTMKNPALKMLIENNKIINIHNLHAITFCNVLFVGTFCAALMIFFTRGPLKIIKESKVLTKGNKLLLAVAILIKALAVSFIFFVLKETTVVQIVLVGQLGGIFYLFFSYFFLSACIQWKEIWGYGVIFLAILALMISQNILTSYTTWLMFGTLLLSKLNDVIDKKLLEGCSESLVAFVENLGGSLVFFLIFSYLYGPMHFADAFTGELWVLMVFYAGITLVIAQLVWLKATKEASPQMVANALLLVPFFGIANAYLFLGEIPSDLQAMVFALIVVGLFITRMTVPPRSVKLERASEICAAKM